MEGLRGHRIVHEPTDLNEKAWSKFVLRNNRGNIFQTPEMYRVYANTERYEPIFTAVLDENDAIMAIMLGVRKEESGFFAKRFSNRVLVSGGPILSDKFDEAALFEKIMKAHTLHVKKVAMFTEVKNLFPSPDLKSNFEVAGYKYFPHLTTTLDLTVGLDSLWSNLSSKKRQGIRKARKKGLTECVLSMDDLEDMYMLFEETYNRIGFPTPHRSLFESVFSVLQSKSLARFIGVRHGKKLVSVVVNLLYRDMIYAWYCAGSMQYTRFHCNEYCFWNAFEWGVNKGFSLFDFGGGGPPKKDDGVRIFKERLGGVTRNTGRFECVHQPLKHKLAIQGYKLWRSIH